ncbi:ABC transporter domain-containing protein [Rozella allomycis CSF55]|uniref:ABC transporter domain-containing protein n=1 Tax=Rozella allomycis (strain CSF55) TaxID=988480 RepID=A0A075B2Y5_ROZAC|nr:ABC transporter domain-containing protein [Rozella allomycis CSF55]|eukprot:EPZ35336.1 ABC transporter domain-containing protein [Rozella allomycis CSF55]
MAENQQQRDEESNTPQTKDNIPKIGYFELYRYASSFEKTMILVGSSLPIMTKLFGGIIKVFGTYEMTRNKDQFNNDVIVYCIYFVILGGASFVVSYLSMAVFMYTGERQVRRIREKYFSSLLQQEVGWFDKQNSGELASRLSGDLQLIQDGISEKVSIVLASMATFVGGFIVAFTEGWQLTLILCCVLPLMGLTGAIMAKFLSKATTNTQDAFGKASALAEEVFSAIRTVTSFNGQTSEVKRYDACLNEALKHKTKQANIQGVGVGFITLFLFSTYSLAFWYGSQLIEKGEYDGGKFITVFFAFMMGAFSIGNVAPNFGAFGSAQGAAYRIFQVLERKPLIEKKKGKDLEQVKGEIEFRNVKFNYPTRPEVSILKGVNLKIKPGQTVALVGSSGSGKSTMVQLVQRFYDPMEGQILIDGQDLRDVNLESFRRHVGIVSQEPILFRNSIKNNIGLGKMNSSTKEIEEAALQANALDFINKLPKGFDTLVGERGSLMSGGQKQRIAIARALIKNPSILLLDEATSALDSVSEKVVQSALDGASKGRTTLVVAHRLSTIKNADLIVVMQQGEIIETGTHEELINKKGKYYELVEAQSLQQGDQVATEAEEIMHLKEEEETRQSLIKQKEEEKVKVENKKGDIWRVYKMALSEWHLLLVGLLGSMVLGSIMPLFGFVFAEILTVFFSSDMVKLRKDADFWSLMFLLIAIASFLANYFKMALFDIAGNRLTLRIRSMSFKAMLSQNIGWFDEDKHATGILTSKLSTEAESIQGLTGSFLGTILQLVATIVIGFIIAFSNSWQLTLVILSCLPLVSLGGYLQVRVLKGFDSKAKAMYEDASQVATEALENIRTVISLSREGYFEHEYQSGLQVPYKVGVTRAFTSSLGHGFAQSIQFFAYTLAYYYGSRLMIDGTIDFSNFNKVVNAVMFTAASLGQIGSFAPNASKAKIAAADIFEIIDRKPSIDNSGTTNLDNPQGTAEVNNVIFKYPTRPDQIILNGINLSVKQGQTVALVGASGCGKSTIIQLLERFYDPLAGSVSVDGNDLKSLNLSSLRTCISLVSQEPLLFARTLRENISYGKQDASIEEIKDAAKAANIADFIESLPDKYETQAGEKGTQLSGGQKQRIAIARALIRHPKLLLLDEATSALDTESEKVVQEALDNASKGRTTIVIAHRLSTIQNADVIYVFKDGLILEKGTHSQLLANKSLYYELVQQQSLK